MKSKLSIDELARCLWFGIIKTPEELATAGWQYRKGKGTSDINNALRKAANFKNGRGKLEIELSMAEVYIRDVLKPIKTKIQ